MRTRGARNPAPARGGGRHRRVPRPPTAGSRCAWRSRPTIRAPARRSRRRSTRRRRRQSSGIEAATIGIVQTRHPRGSPARSPTPGRLRNVRRRELVGAQQVVRTCARRQRRDARLRLGEQFTVDMTIACRRRPRRRPARCCHDDQRRDRAAGRSSRHRVVDQRRVATSRAPHTPPPPPPLDGVGAPGVRRRGRGRAPALRSARPSSFRGRSYRFEDGAGPSAAAAPPAPSLAPPRARRRGGRPRERLLSRARALDPTGRRRVEGSGSPAPPMFEVVGDARCAVVK